MTRLTTLQQISSPGSRDLPNEDGAGAFGRYAWIIDGATGVAGQRLTPAASDAAWLARLLDDKLAARAIHGIALTALEREVDAAFANATAGAAPGVHGAPSACLGLIEVRENGRATVLEGAFLGDVVALVPTPDGVARWTDERAKPFEQLTLASLERAGGGGLSDATRAQIMENRASLNRPDGYWVVHPGRPWAGHQLIFETTIEAPRPIVLATDGFMRLVDVFEAHSDMTLYDALADGRAAELLDELRRLELEEGGPKLRPRVKVHDDATVIVVAAQAGP